MMIRGAPALLGPQVVPLARPFCSGPRRSIRLSRPITCQMKADTDTQGRKWEAVLAAALIAAAVGAGLPGDLMPKGHAEESLVERRRADANKRKELLSKARSDALKRGGIDAGSSGAPAPAPTQEASVNAAQAEEPGKAVEESMKAPSALSASVLERLKKASADYEKQANSGPAKPKDAPNPELPSWLKERIQRSQAEPEQKDTPAPAPEKPSGGFSLPSFPAKVKEEKPAEVPAQPLKYDNPAPEPAPVSAPKKQPEAPSIPPAKVDSTPAAPLKAATPPPSPPKAAPAPAPAPTPAPSSSKEQGVDFNSFFKGALDSPASPPKEEAKPKSPAPQTIIKAPLLRRDEPKPAVKQAAPAPKPGKPGKRKGPLPLWLAEIIVILGLGGILFATAKWSDELEKLWGKAAAQLEALYNKIDKRQASSQ